MSNLMESNDHPILNDFEKFELELKIESFERGSNNDKINANMQTDSTSVQQIAPANKRHFSKRRKCFNSLSQARINKHKPRKISHKSKNNFLNSFEVDDAGLDCSEMLATKVDYFDVNKIKTSSAKIKLLPWENLKLNRPKSNEIIK